MAVLKERRTGSVVNVPDEKVAQVLAVGYYEVVSGKTATKKTAVSKGK